jgi:hypothetical protein
MASRLSKITRLKRKKNFGLLLELTVLRGWSSRHQRKNRDNVY